MANKHRGKRIQIYLQAPDLGRLDELVTLSRHQTRADAVRMLIRGAPIVDRSFGEALAALGRIGGLIKRDRLLPPESVAELRAIINDMRAHLYGRDRHQGQQATG